MIKEGSLRRTTHNDLLSSIHAACGISKRSIVSVSGQGGLGKTNFSSILSKRIDHIEFTSVDGYLPDRIDRPPTSPEADELVDYRLVQQHVDNFIAGREIELRRYDHTYGRAVLSDNHTVEATKILIVEGGLVSAKLRPDSFHYSIVFLSTDDDYRQLRREVDRNRGYAAEVFPKRFYEYLSVWKKYQATIIKRANKVVRVLPSRELVELVTSGNETQLR